MRIGRSPPACRWPWPSTPERWPSWKIHTMAPNVADRLSRFSTMALSGMTRLPNIMNSSTIVMAPITPRAIGSRSNSEALMSTSWAPWPVTCTANGAGASARVVDQLGAGVGQRLDRGHHRQPRPAAGGEARGGRTSQQHQLAWLQPSFGQALAAVRAGGGVDPRHAGQHGQRRGVVADLLVRRTAGVGRDHRQRPGLGGGEAVAEHVVDAPGLGRLGQHPVVGLGQLEASRNGAPSTSSRAMAIVATGSDGASRTPPPVPEASVGGLAATFRTGRALTRVLEHVEQGGQYQHREQPGQQGHGHPA